VIVAMQSAHQAAEICSEVQRKACFYRSDGAASDCSTVCDHQEVDVRDNDDCLSACNSDSCLEVETLQIFDWDDTLFPTSWLQHRGLFSSVVTLSREEDLQLEELAASIKATLKLALQFGKVVIVTNAEQFWVERSCTSFMPSLVGLLMDIDIISARTAYEQGGREPSEWKCLAFASELDHFCGSQGDGHQWNIVSLGDSLHELTALKSVTKDMPDCCAKSIKLFDVPSIEQLIEQHELLLNCLLDVVEHNGDMDVEIGADSF